MTNATQAIFEQALRLNPVERDERIDALWAVESESRIDAFDAGQTQFLFPISIYSEKERTQENKDAYAAGF